MLTMMLLAFVGRLAPHCCVLLLLDAHDWVSRIKADREEQKKADRAVKQETTKTLESLANVPHYSLTIRSRSVNGCLMDVGWGRCA